MVETDFLNGDRFLVAQKAQQQPEGVTIGADRVDADLASCWQVNGKEFSELVGDSPASRGRSAGKQTAVDRLQRSRQVREHGGGQAQVALRPSEILVAHVGREHWQLHPEVRAFTVPRLQAVDGVGMAQIMDARSVPAPGCGIRAT